MVTQRVSAKAWLDIEQQLGLGAADFITARVYADEQTIALASACATKLDLDLSEFFEQFGEFWVGFAVAGPYRGVMQATGRTLPEFLANLDNMHVTVRSAMPDAQTPFFDLVEQNDDQLLVRYRSDRQGLEPLVKGLLVGLIAYFGLTGTVTPFTGPDGDSLFRLQLVGNH